MPRKMGMQLSTALKVDQSFEVDDVVTDFGVDIDSQSAASSSVLLEESNLERSVASIPKQHIHCTALRSPGFSKEASTRPICLTE